MRTCTDWVWVAIGVGSLLVVLVVIVVVVLLVQRCRRQRGQAAAYHAEPPTLPTSYGMSDVLGGGGGRGSGGYGGRPSGGGSGTGFGIGAGVNDYTQRSPSPSPPAASAAAAAAANGLAFSSNVNGRAGTGLGGGVSNAAFYGPSEVDTGRSLDTGLPDQIPRATLGAPRGPPTTASPTPASGTFGHQIRPPQAPGQQREDFV